MPWQMSYAASADLENAELQTDVMRFMAILAFCLVAIFAIVQSIPLDATPEVDNTSAETVAKSAVTNTIEPARVEVTQVKPEPIRKKVEPSPPVRIARPDPARVVTAPKPVLPAPQAKIQVPETIRPSAVSKPIPKPVPPAPVLPAPEKALAPTPIPSMPAPVPVSSPAQLEQRGLSLRFESDSVLRNLVERRLVSLYAIYNDTFFTMQVAGMQLQFSADSKPARYHEMVFETVPREVASAFERQTSMSARSVTWGVTLPAATTSQLQRFARTRFSGGLVIDSNASLMLDGSQ